MTANRVNADRPQRAAEVIAHSGCFNEGFSCKPAPAAYLAVTRSGDKCVAATLCLANFALGGITRHHGRPYCMKRA